MKPLNLSECESGPQRGGLYLDSLLLDAALWAQDRNRRPDEDWALCAEVLLVLALRGDGIAVCEKVEALDERGLSALVQQCRKCVWDAHFSQVRNTVPADGFRLLMKLFLP